MSVFVPAVFMTAVTRDYVKPKQVAPMCPSHNKVVTMSGINSGRHGDGSALLERDHLVMCKVEVVEVNARWLLKGGSEDVICLI